MMMMGWAVMNASMLEANMNAVERITEYTGESVPQEAARRTKDVPSDWPREGKIRFDGLSVKYRPQDDAVLRNLKVRQD